MKILSILLLCLPLFSMDKEEVQNIVNESLLSSLDGMTGTIELMLIGLGLLFSFFSIFGFISFFGKKQIRKELQGDIELLHEKSISHINKLFRTKSQEMQDEMQEKVMKHIKSNIKLSQKLSQKEEYLRNIIFFDLNKLLSSELDNGNASEVFLIFADRFHIIAQLTSGDSNKTKKALHKLTTDSKKEITRLSSVKNYVLYMEESADDDVLEYIEAFKTTTCAIF